MNMCYIAIIPRVLIYEVMQDCYHQQYDLGDAEPGFILRFVDGFF